MSFLAPQYLLLAAGAGVAIVVLHFYARHRPPPAILPTARFIPARFGRATTSSRRLADPWLLLLRLALVGLAGAGLARPVFSTGTRPIGRIVIADVSRTSGNLAELRDSALAVLAEGDVLIVVDSTARRVAGPVRDSVLALRAVSARGSISAGLIAALRAASDLSETADSIELVIISSFAREVTDAATPAIRKLWRGRARLIRQDVQSSPRPVDGVHLRASLDDPLSVTLALLGRQARQEAALVRLVRSSPTTADSAWVSGDRRLASELRVLVHWPALEPSSERTREERADTTGAAVAGDVVVVAPFERSRRLPEGPALARWLDGEPAAVEHALGTGCIRDVAIPVAAAGDLVLRAPFLRLVDALTEPCGGRPDLTPPDESLLSTLAGSGALLSRRSGPTSRPSSPLAGWLLAGALALALAEPAVRRRRSGP